MATKQQTLPPCGLHKATQPIEIGETRIEKDQLLSFHNHSDKGDPVLIFPSYNTHNRWVFEQPVYLKDVSTVMKSLIRLKPEGLYRLQESFRASDKEVVNKNSLVQLGYTAKAEPIIFYPQTVDWGNAISFPSQGQKISGSIYKLLELLDTRGSSAKKTES